MATQVAAAPSPESSPDPPARLSIEERHVLLRLCQEYQDIIVQFQGDGSSEAEVIAYHQSFLRSLKAKPEIEQFDFWMAFLKLREPEMAEKIRCALIMADFGREGVEEKDIFETAQEALRFHRRQSEWLAANIEKPNDDLMAGDAEGADAAAIICSFNRSLNRNSIDTDSNATISRDGTEENGPQIDVEHQSGASQATRNQNRATKRTSSRGKQAQKPCRVAPQVNLADRERRFLSDDSTTRPSATPSSPYPGYPSDESQIPGPGRAINRRPNGRNVAGHAHVHFASASEHVNIDHNEASDAVPSAARANKKTPSRSKKAVNGSESTSRVSKRTADGSEKAANPPLYPNSATYSGVNHDNQATNVPTTSSTVTIRRSPPGNPSDLRTTSSIQAPTYVDTRESQAAKGRKRPLYFSSREINNRHGAAEEPQRRTNGTNGGTAAPKPAKERKLKRGEVQVLEKDVKQTEEERVKQAEEEAKTGIAPPPRMRKRTRKAS